MHPEAYAFVQSLAPSIALDAAILEIGSRDVNSTAQGLNVRDLFPAARYVGIDVCAGPGVDYVTSCLHFDGGTSYDAVIATEVLEHMPDPESLIDCAARALRRGGLLILTCASYVRAPHGVDGGPVGTEHYAGIHPDWLHFVLAYWTDVKIVHVVERGDIYASARWPHAR